MQCGSDVSRSELNGPGGSIFYEPVYKCIFATYGNIYYYVNGGMANLVVDDSHCSNLHPFPGLYLLFINVIILGSISLLIWKIHN